MGRSLAGCLLVLCLTSAVSGVDWLTGWDHRYVYTVSDVNVTVNLADFTIYWAVSNNSDMADAQNDGDDVRFTASDGTTLLSHEPFSITGRWTGGGASNVTASTWVTLPLIAASGGATFYVYWGKADASADGDSDATWDANYVAVWHFDEASYDGTADEVIDYSGTGNHGASQNGATVAAGALGNAASFDGTDDRIAVDDSATLHALPGIYISAWAKFVNSGDQYQRFIDYPTNFRAYIDATGAVDGRLGISIYTDSTEVDNVSGSSVNLTPNVWSHGGWSWGPTDTVVNRWIDGSADDSPPTVAGNVTDDDAATLYIGDQAASDRSYKGLIDELRIEATPRDLNWHTFAGKQQGSVSHDYSHDVKEDAPVTGNASQIITVIFN